MSMFLMSINIFICQMKNNKKIQEKKLLSDVDVVDVNVLDVNVVDVGQRIQFVRGEIKVFCFF